MHPSKYCADSQHRQATLEKAPLLVLPRGIKDSSVVKHRTQDQKVAGSSPGRNGGRFFLLQGQLSVRNLILVKVVSVSALCDCSSL